MGYIPRAWAAMGKTRALYIEPAQAPVAQRKLNVAKA